MNTLKHILSRYTAFLWAILKPLGAGGVLAAAALDGAAVGLPVDLVVGGYVSQNHRQWLIYVLMAASGSALGSLVIYAIGYAGGEELLHKRVSAARFAKLHNAFEKHPFWSLLFPAMLPPPPPFTALALGAAVAEMSISHFLLAIFLGRFLRFAALAGLVIYFGPGAVGTIRVFFSRHFHWVVLIAAAGVATWLIVRRRTAKQRRSELLEHTES
jgi:membrane protein YqaA with SNARE-associated domain